MNNPIQERFDKLLLKWTVAIETPKTKIIRIYGKHDEQIFIDDFFEYMLALDTKQKDLVFLLESPWDSLDEFSEVLLEELYETIEIWNNTEKKELLPKNKVDWKPNKDFKDPINPAALFVKNINQLANYLIPDKDVIISFILKIPFADIPNVNLWLKNVIEMGLESHVRIGISDIETDSVYSKIATWFPNEVYTLYPELNVDDAVEKMAAMGDPSLPDTNYRKHLVVLMNAVKDRDAKKVDYNAKKCLDIASENVINDINWLGQIIMVYTILYNDQIGYKDYGKALFFSNKAVEAGMLSVGRMEPSAAYRLYGQTLLGRGTILRLLNQHEKACKDYKIASECYESCNDYIMQCESIRLYADEAKKIGKEEEALDELIKAFYLIDKMPSENIQYSTYPWIVKRLFSWKGREEVLPIEKMEKKLIPHFGEDYMNKIKKYGKPSQIKQN